MEPDLQKSCRESPAEATASAKTEDGKQVGAFEQKAATAGSSEQWESTEGLGVPPVSAGSHRRVIGGGGSGLAFSPCSVFREAALAAGQSGLRGAGESREAYRRLEVT